MTADPLIKRINVPVSPDTVEALQRVIIREGCTLAQAVHRLVLYGDALATALDVDAGSVTVQGLDGTYRIERQS